MLENKKIRTALWTGATLSLVAGGVFAGVAMAAAPPGAAKANAPYAQAAAVLNADGSVNRSKGIERVTKPAEGQYCIELEDKSLDINKLVANATLQKYSFDYDVQISNWPHPTCGTRSDTYLVVTGKPGVWADASFSFTVS
ncbi:hypothetical protein [Streptomyces sp. NPDC060031]|uniref:hypothetical protein n=1 Tax=Streptomyces sp. NPDC060031 TaxID=3347043 RepID=UPI003693CCDA